MEEKATPTVSRESAAKENLAKQPFEKNVEILLSILEEAESGYRTNLFT